MARREIFVDDLDGKEHEDVESRRFSIGRTAYTIDLSAGNYESFLKDMEKYTSVATQEEAPARSLQAPANRQPRQRGAGAVTGPNKPITVGGKTAKEVREILRGEGHEVKDGGRLSNDQKEKYTYHTKDEFL